MRYLIVVLFLCLVGCDDMRLEDRFAQSCQGNSQHTFYVTDRCILNWAIDEMFVSVAYINETLDTNIQMCGTVKNTSNTTVKWVDCNPANIPAGNAYTTGRYGGHGHITIYQNRTRGLLHFREIIRHEFGHYFGASHSSNPDDVMYPYWSGVTKYTEHDIRSMSRLR